MKLYLASKSKFKSQILDKVYINHECIDVNVKEESTKTNAHEYVMELAKLKAMEQSYEKHKKQSV